MFLWSPWSLAPPRPQPCGCSVAVLWTLAAVELLGTSVAPPTLQEPAGAEPVCSNPDRHTASFLLLSVFFFFFFEVVRQSRAKVVQYDGLEKHVEIHTVSSHWVTDCHHSR